MSFDAGELNTFFSSAIWRDMVRMLCKELDDTTIKLLGETEPILIGKLQGRSETLRNMLNLHQKYISEEDAAELLVVLDRLANESSIVAPFREYAEYVDKE